MGFVDTSLKEFLVSFEGKLRVHCKGWEDVGLKTKEILNRITKDNNIITIEKIKEVKD